MPRIFRVVFILGVLILCCKPYRGNIDGNGQLIDGEGKRYGKRVPSVVSPVQFGKAYGLSSGKEPHNKLGLDLSVNIKPTDDLSELGREKGFGMDNSESAKFNEGGEESDRRKHKQRRTPEEVYAELKASIDNLKALYFYRPERFSQYILDRIMYDLRNRYTDYYKNNVYAAVNGDMHTLSRLEVIVSYPVGFWGSEYKYPRHLFNTLRTLGDLIFKVIDERGTMFSDANLSKLRESQDFDCIDKMTANLNVMYVKWIELVKLIQERIIEASKLSTTSNMSRHLSVITNLFEDSVNFEEEPMRMLKDDLTKLRSSLRVKLYEFNVEMNFGNKLTL
ncbi:hypothetical protein [Borrelia persica]|uniref:hypothetical protein n=1 Tax=Borrelia persica TaxID=44448 RepID=UPI000463AD76|nr:hypothetical protein [Borrelia persica]